MNDDGEWAPLIEWVILEYPIKSYPLVTELLTHVVKCQIW